MVLGDGERAICWEGLLLETEEPKEEGTTDTEKGPQQTTEAASHVKDMFALSNQSDIGAFLAYQLDHPAEDFDSEL